MFVDTELYNRFGVFADANDYEIPQSLFWLRSIDRSVFLGAAVCDTRML
jgi:hypothetical protein